MSIRFKYPSFTKIRKPRMIVVSHFDAPCAISFSVVVSYLTEIFHVFPLFSQGSFITKTTLPFFIHLAVLANYFYVGQDSQVFHNHGPVTNFTYLTLYFFPCR